MNSLSFKTAVLLLGLIASAYGFIDYKGYKIYEIVPSTRAEADFLFKLSERNEEIDMLALTKIPNTPARALVPPQFQREFQNNLILNRMLFKVVSEDVARSMVHDRFEMSYKRSGKRSILESFYRVAEINAYLDDLAQRFSNRVLVQEVGVSHEGRSIKSITISNGKSNFSDKKVIFVDAGIHAREWIAPSAALYIIHQLVENFEKNKDLLEECDWIVIPVINVDGYEYSHERTRLWRKTRKPSSSSCVGTDGNRNFDFKWGLTGASTNPCSDTFRGEKAFSEPETQIIRDKLLSLTGRGKMYLTLHSHGNYLLYPWGYTSELPKTWKDLDEVCQAGAEAMKRATGARYTVGSSTNVLYAAAGGSDDYALAVAKIPIAVTMELPGGGMSGFNPPPSKIRGMVEETWVGIKAMAEKVIEKY